MYFNGKPLPGLLISGQDTYLTWEMIPTKRLHVVPPEPKTTYVDLPGANGGIDYTELLTGFPTYGYRKGSWEFLLIPAENWSAVYQDLVETFHGKHHEIILQDDPNYYYTGRLKVNEWQSNAYNSLITIDYVLDPERKSVSGDPPDHDEEDLAHAGRILRKEENQGKAIIMQNGNAVLVDESSLNPPTLSVLSATSNGTYSPEEGIDGFSQVIISVPAVVPVFESLNVSSNGTFTPRAGVDGFSQVVVNVITGEDGNSIYYPGENPYDPQLEDGDNISY